MQKSKSSNENSISQWKKMIAQNIFRLYWIIKEKLFKMALLLNFVFTDKKWNDIGEGMSRKFVFKGPGGGGGLGAAASQNTDSGIGTYLGYIP